MYAHQSAFVSDVCQCANYITKTASHKMLDHPTNLGSYKLVPHKTLRNRVQFKATSLQFHYVLWIFMVDISNYVGFSQPTFTPLGGCTTRCMLGQICGTVRSTDGRQASCWNPDIKRLGSDRWKHPGWGQANEVLVYPLSIENMGKK